MVEWNNQFIQFHNLFYNLQITAAKKHWPIKLYKYIQNGKQIIFVKHYVSCMMAFVKKVQFQRPPSIA